MSIYYQDEQMTLHHGDSLGVTRGMPDGSADCVVTSPPYYGLRDYGSDGQYGHERTPTEYVAKLQELFSEVRRVLADDGTFWLNLGDSYGGEWTAGSLANKSAQRKNLLGIPWRAAFALQDDGWILRNSIIWHKPNAMPEPVGDRMSGRHENLFMFVKNPRYWFDLDSVRERPTRPPGRTWAERKADGEPLRYGLNGQAAGAVGGFAPHPRGKNPGDIWPINTEPFPGAHFAVMPTEMARKAVVAGCKPGGTVFDPFSGSGTTGMAAQNSGRKYVGIDINAEYLKLSLETRLQNAALDLGELA